MSLMIAKKTIDSDAYKKKRGRSQSIISWSSYIHAYLSFNVSTKVLTPFAKHNK